MTIAKDFASKFSVAFVAIAMLFTLVAPAVNAQESSEDLQKTIADLLAQVAELEGKMGGKSTGGSSSCESIPAPLTMGSKGANVTALQNRLIADGESIPAGATGYFGAQTKAALASWQGKNSVSPAVGYYGPLTMAAMDAACDDEDATDEDEDDSDDSSSDELQGEGELNTFEIDNASDTDVQEGAEDAEIAELKLEAQDGDIEVARMDFKLYTDGDNTENDPWDVFDTISVWVDGDMVAEFDATDEDNYLDEDNGTFRVSGLDLVLMEDEETEVTIGATVQESVDDAGVSDEDDWSIRVDEVRYFDADGVATDEDSVDQIGSPATFKIVEAGDGEELKFSLGDNNPEATDIIVDEDDTTDGVTILEYTIEAKEGDIELQNLAVKLDVTGDTTQDVVDDVMLVIDGEEFDAEGSLNEVNGSTTAQFDIDGDVTIDEDAEVTVEVVVDFKSQATYANGTTIKASVESAQRALTDAEGADDLDSSDFSGSAVGDTHTLVAEGIVVPVDGFTSSVDTLGQNDTIGEYTLEFEVTAIEGDFYIKEFATSTNATTNTGGVEFAVEPAAAGTITSVLESTGDEDTPGVFTVEEGETETFTLTVTYDPAAAGSFRVQLEEVWYSPNTNGSSALPYVPTPASDFRTANKAINQ